MDFNFKNVALYGGLTIVVGTHLAMVVDLIPMSSMLEKETHAIANLMAGLIIYGSNLVD